MGQSKRPKKPDRPSVSVVFPKEGSPFSNVERYPRTQHELEFAMCQKFVGAMGQSYERRLFNLQRGEEPSDLICETLDGEQVGIQVAEAIDPRLRELRAMRTAYLDVLRGDALSALRSFSGCRATLVDLGDPPYLPLVASEPGRKCVRQIVDWLASLGTRVAAVPVGGVRRYGVKVGPDQRSLSLRLERFALSSDEVPCQLEWSGAGPSYQADKSRDVLPAVIRSKIDKMYEKPRYRFLLLVYSTDTLFHEQDPDVTEATRLLTTRHHSFDEVWYLYPYAGETLGHLVRLWRAPDVV